MYRIDDPSAVAKMPEPEAVGVPGFFTEGTPGVQQATLVRAAWLNAVQEELMAIIAAGGQAPSKTNYGQLLAALRSAGTFKTAAQFDISTKVATMEALKRGAGGFAGSVSLISSRNLLASDFGNVLRGTAGLLTLTLPTPASLGANVGDAVQLFSNTGSTLSVMPGPGVSLNYDGAIPSLLLKSGQSATLVVGGAGVWQFVNSTADLWCNADFARTTGSNNYYRLPGGRIVQEGSGLTDANGQLIVTFPISFVSSGSSFKSAAIHSGNSPLIIIEVKLLRGLAGTVFQAYMPNGAAVGAGYDINWKASGF